MNPLTYAKIGAVVLVGGLFAWQHNRYQSLQYNYDQHMLADAAAIVRGKDILINKERAHMAALAAMDAKLTKDYSDALATRDTLIAGLNSGTERVQDRFRCPTVARVPGTPASPGASDGAEESGFTDQDAAVALGIASEGDQAIIALTACQDVVRSDRR